MKKAVLVLAGLFMSLAVVFSNYLPAQGQKEITVAAAHNLKYSLEKIKIIFEKETGIKVNLVFGASGKLTEQIKNGAPFHVFLSADKEFPDKVYAAGLAANKPQVYAYGFLVIWFSEYVDFKKTGPQILLDGSMKKIAVANPKIAPYGRAAEEYLEYAKLKEKVKDKMIYGEGIAQVTQYVVSKTVDVGFSGKAVVMAEELKGKGVWFELDPKSYKPIEQSIVILKYGNENASAESKKFYDFVFSKQAKEIFKTHGFKVD